MTRPSSTAATRVAKLSSRRMTSEASLVTSVPETPMATPMSASFTAGASLTPSPVMAVMCPRRLKARTIFSLSLGLTRAKTVVSSMTRSSSASLMAESSPPERTRSPGRQMPVSRAMAQAVALWSPVIITVLIPAFRLRETASLASFRGGSIIPARPAKISPPADPASPSVRLVPGDRGL